MKKHLKYIIPSLITIILLLIIYYINDLYPFQDNSIVQVDADYQYIPVLYKIYDLLHGKGNLLYSDIGLGNSIYTSLIIQGSLFSPINLLLYFTKRSNINNYFNIIVMIKMALISLTSYIYFKYKYKTNEFYLILFSIIYTFSGWVILNYFNIMWLDSVILFPLIMLYLDKLLKENKYYGYIITLSLSCIISYYISTYILMFIFIYSFLYIFIILKKEERKKTILLLGITTLISLLISSFSIVPALYHTLNSSRLIRGGNYPLFNHTINKILYLMGMSLPLVLLIKTILKYKKDKKNIYIYLVLLFLYSVGIILEPINLAMHFGSYWSFPYRYSFITIFILISISLYYVSKYDIKEKKFRIIPLFLIIMFIPLLKFFNDKYLPEILHGQITLDFNKWDIFKYILIMLISFIVIKILTLMLGNKLLIKIFLVITTLLEILITTSWCMYYNSGYFLTNEANQLNNTLDLDHNYLHRYKLSIPYYSTDYAFILDVNTLDNWLHILPKGMTNTYKSLGYLNSDTSIKALGGTIFTDNLFNMNYIISRDILDSNMYTPIDIDKNYKLYQYNTKLPYGIIYNTNNLITNDDNTGFYLHNNLYKSLFNKDNNLIDIKTFYLSDNNNCINISDTLDNNSYIYLDLTNDGKKISSLKVNDDYVYYLDNYIKYIGIYDKELNMEICPKENETIDYIDLGIISISKYQLFTNSINNHINITYNNGYNIKIDNDKDNQSLFLPLNNIKGLDIRLNDEKIKPDNYLDNFVSIKLLKGENNIRIKYHEPYLILGIILSVLGVLLIFGIKYIKWNHKYLLNITYYFYIFLGLIIYFYFYVYCFVKK